MTSDADQEIAAYQLISLGGVIAALEEMKPESTPERYYVGYNEALDAAVDRVQAMPATGLSPELLAMIADVKPASDEWIAHTAEFATTFDASYTAEEVLSLIASIVAERKVEAWDRNKVCRAAEKANERYGQFMPQQWIDFFMQEYERIGK